MRDATNLSRNGPREVGWLSENSIFYGIASLMSDDARAILVHPDSAFDDDGRAWLWSDFGWSVYLDIVGDKDPCEVSPQLVYIELGVPTDVKTGERRRLLRDIQKGVKEGTSSAQYHYPLLKGKTYLPSAAAQVICRREFWARQEQAFELLIFHDLQQRPYLGGEMIPVDQHQQFHDVETHRLNTKQCYDTTRYRTALTSVWNALVAPPDCCEHGSEDGTAHTPLEPARLGQDVVAVVGYCGPYTHKLVHKVIIYLTSGDKRLSWLALSLFERAASTQCDTPRTAMVRHPECCPSCALEYTASLPGRWVLIL